MGQDVRDDSRVCRTPPGPRKDLNHLLRPRTIFFAVGLSFMLTTSLLYYLMLPPAIPPAPPPPFEPPPPLPTLPPPTLRSYITIDGDANFSDTALLEGWPGDGSPENPYIIDGLDIEVDRGHIRSISNTRVSFTISNCDLTGGHNGPIARGAGIYLENVTNGELVNNIFTTLVNGIWLYGSSSNTVFNNTCSTETFADIVLDYSDYNTVANNTCTYYNGISLYNSDYNTVANNTCSSNDIGISLESSDSNTVANNTCTSNEIGIELSYSISNTVANNTCNNNRIGIHLYKSYSNTVANNTCLNNTEHDILGEYMTEEDGTEEFDPVFLLFIGFAGIIMLGAGWKLLSGIREFN